jgi:hypothetical protein
MTTIALTMGHEIILLNEADLDGELAATEAITVAPHRRGCGECKTAYRVALAARAAVQRLGNRHLVPTDVKEALLARLRQSGDVRKEPSAD